MIVSPAGAPAFCHLHVHTQYSMLDGLCRPAELAARARELGMSALAMTDHGGVYGAIDFYRACRAKGVRPILGCEVYVAADHRRREGREEPLYHLTLLAETAEGYRNLLRLVTRSHVDGFHYKPRVDRDLLARHAGGLIALTGCLSGEAAQHILAGTPERARESLSAYRDLFGPGHVFVELQDHGLAEERKVVFWLRRLAADLGLDLVATNDVHYLDRADARLHEILLGVQTLSTLNNRRLKLETSEHYLKPPAEMAALFGGVPEALANTVAIAERCAVEIDLGQYHFPRVDVPPGFTPETYLEHLCRDGAAARFGDPLPAAAAERLAGELATIAAMGFAGYFLIVWDIVRFARSAGIPVGTGRGSAAGSLVAYVLGITDVDPLRYGLLFERFLNPERISMPDIDVDLCHWGRQAVLDYIRNKYGTDRVAHVGAYATLQARAVLRDAGRALGLPYRKIDNLTRAIPYSHLPVEDILCDFPHLRQWYESDPEIREVFDAGRRLQGLPRHLTQHSAGVVISAEPLTDHTALQRAGGEEIVTQFDMHGAEEAGLLKIDLLGLRYLSVIHEALKQINRRRGLSLTPADIPLDDPATFRRLRRADTACCFQLESTGMRRLLRRLRPRGLEDVIAALSLFRPGPLRSGMADEYIARRNGRRAVTYPHPLLEPVLRTTYGVILYQEQVMQVAHAIAGYSLGEADLLRRAIAKQQKDVLARERPRFLAGARARGVDAARAEALFEIVNAFGDYGFNRSHSVAYGIMAYWTVYLWTHYPAEYMAALLSLNMDLDSRFRQYLTEARRNGLELLLPDVNASETGFVPEGGRGIRIGLAMVKNAGEKAIAAILRERGRGGPYASFLDFCSRVDGRVVNRRVIESLILAGAFDSLEPSRPQLLLSLRWVLQTFRRVPSPDQLSFFDDRDHLDLAPLNHRVSNFDDRKLLELEHAYLGHYFTRHPLELLEAEAVRGVTHTVADLADIGARRDVRLAGVIVGTRLNRTRGGERMAFASLEDLTGVVELVAFPAVLRRHAELFSESALVAVDGYVDVDDDGERTVVVKSMEGLGRLDDKGFFAKA